MKSKFGIDRPIFALVLLLALCAIAATTMTGCERSPNCKKKVACEAVLKVGDPIWFQNKVVAKVGGLSLDITGCYFHFYMDPQHPLFYSMESLKSEIGSDGVLTLKSPPVFEEQKK